MTSLILKNILSDISIVDRTKYFSVVRDKLVEDRFAKKAVKFIDSDFSKKHILKIVEYVHDKIDKFGNNLDIKKALINLGNKIITLFFSNSSVQKTIILFDRFLAKIRPKHNFLLKENLFLFKKWQSYGFKKEIFYKYVEFSEFLFDSLIASQMKITKDGIREIDEEPAILVEGEWTKFSEIKKRFSFKKSDKYKEIFVYEKETNKVFTYLPNGQGLCQFHPYIDAAKPVGKITDEEYQKVLLQAQKFERKYANDKKNYKHVLQIVTSKPQNNFFYDRMNLFKIFEPQHPYIRIIDGDTKQFYVISYCGTPFAFSKFLTNLIGHFRSLDIWEYKNCKEKVVTFIPINEEEEKKILYFCKKFINDDIFFGKKIVFNYMKQNCTSFIRKIVDYAIGQKIITDLKIHEIIYLVMPNFLRKLGFFIKNAIYSMKNKIVDLFPDFLKEPLKKVVLTINKIWSNLVAVCLATSSLLFGGIIGKRARKLKDPDKNIDLSPPLRNVSNWFKYSFFKFDIPAPLQVWQLKQESTVIFNKPKLLTIVPN